MKKTIKKIAALAILTGFVILAAFPFAPIMAHAQSTGGTQGGGYLNSIVTNGLNTGPGTTLNTQPSTQKSTTPSAPNDPLSCDSVNPTCAVYFVAYLFNQLIVSIISLGAFFIAAFLAISASMYNSPVIATGFSVCLAFANLGFVLFLIIIAVATIIRIESYGMKKNLFKLIAMAILVNFGLVITMPIIAFSNNVSGYFVNQIAPPSGGHDIGTIITAAFEPQAFNTRISAPTSTTNVAGWLGGSGGLAGGALTGAAVGSFIPIPVVGTVLGGIVGGIFGGIGGYTAGSVYHAIHDTNFNNQFVDMVIGMITSSAVLGITAFTLLLIGFMLLIRYVYLTVLLIILPLAWLAYVLPGMKSHFSKWWSLFFKWTFFPVIALFFLYLALLIISTQAAAGISFNTNVPQGLAAQSLEDIVLAGLILGGLFAANSLGLAGSKAFGNFAGNIRSGVAGYAGGIAARQGKKAASRLVPQKAMETLQSGGVPLLPKRLQVAAGTGLGNIQRAGGAKLIEKEADWAKQHSANPDEAKRLLASGGISEHRQIALIKALADKNKISHDVKVGDATIGDFLDSNENSLNRNGQGGLIKATNGLLGSNKKMRDANRGLKQATTPQEKEQAKQILEKETDEYFSEEGKDGVGKMNVNSAFGEKAFEENPELAKAQLNSIAQRQSHLLSSIVKNANGKTLNKLFGNDRTSGEYGKLLEDETRKELGSEEHSQKKARVQSLHEEALQKLNQGQDFDSLSEEIKTTLATNKQAHEIAMKDLADTFKNATRDLKSQSEITAAQREYDDKVANLKAKTQAGYITTLTQKSKEALNAIDTEARNNIRKKMGADKVEKILLNNTFTAGADASTPAPTTNP